MSSAQRFLAPAVLAGIATVGLSTSALADSAVINFTTNITPAGFSGPQALSPFVPGTGLNALVNGLGGFGELGPDDPGGPRPSLASPDWLRYTGQIYIPDFAGDGTYTITPTNGVGGIYLHSPLLNRLEAVSLRTEGALTQASLDAGAGRADGAPTQNRDDIYLPDFTPNGTFTVEVSGSNVEVNYLLDFTTLSDENAQFLRDGITDTQIGDLITAEGVQFGSIGFGGSGTAVVQSALIGSGDEDAFPYGGYSDFDAVVQGNLSNTIIPTTRGVIDNEIAAMNISSDGRSGDPMTDTVFLTDPFAGESGTTFFFDLTGGADFESTVSFVPIPEPASLSLLGVAGLGLMRRRRA